MTPDGPCPVLWCIDTEHCDGLEFAHHGAETEIKFDDGGATVALHQFVDGTTGPDPVQALLETQPSSFMSEADLRALAALLLKTADQVAALNGTTMQALAQSAVVQ